MELQNQLANLEDEIKLLKGEIKSILKEIRAAVLSSDNPFSNPSALRQAPAPAPEAAPVEEPAPFAPRAVEVGQRADAAAPQPETPFSEPVPLHPQPAAPAEPAESRVSLLTIAALLSWSEDAIAILGARRFRFMLDMAFFADLLSPGVRDVLRDASEMWDKDTDSDQPVGVNECVLQLRQLEAIIQGDRVERLPRQRQKRKGA